MPAVDPRKDYYALLQLGSSQFIPGPPAATLGQANLAREAITVKNIKSAYYRLAKVFHPDKTGGNEQAAEHFKKVLEAYEVLSDPDTRRQYDGLRAQAMAAQAATDAAMAAQRAQAFHATQASENGAWSIRRDQQNRSRDQAEQKKKAGASSGPTYWTYANAAQWQPPPKPERQQAKPEKQKGKPQEYKARAQRQEADAKRRQAQSEEAQTESHWYQAGGENSEWSHTAPEDFAPPPPRPEEPKPAPPDPTPDLPENFDFSIYTFHHYFDNKFRERPFLRLLRANVEEGRHEVRRAQVALYVARHNVLKFGASYVRTMESIRYEAELRERETWEIWWKEELERRVQWLKAHEDMAKLRRGVERIRIVNEKQAEEAGKKAVEQERENVRMKAQGGKVEVIEIDDSDEDDDGLFGAPFDPSQEDELLGDTTIGSSL